MEEGKIYFIGLVIIVLGSLILVYDYPQMIYIQTVTTQELELFDKAVLDKFERIKIEFYMGVSIFVAGAAILFLAKFTPTIFNKK